MKEHRFIAVLALVILGFCIAGRAQAQTRVTPCDPNTPNNAICIQWTHDGKLVDGTTAPAVTYRVEQKFGSGAFATVAAALTVKQYYGQNLAVGTYTLRVYAKCALTECVESNPSNAQSQDATANPKQPTPPVLIIAATIRAGKPPIFRIVYTVKPKEGEFVFLAPESMRPVFAAR